MPIKVSNNAIPANAAANVVVKRVGARPSANQSLSKRTCARASVGSSCRTASRSSRVALAEPPVKSVVQNKGHEKSDAPRQQDNTGADERSDDKQHQANAC